MKKLFLSIFVIIALSLFGSNGAFAETFNGTWYPWMGTNWDPGPNTASNNYDSNGNPTFPSPGYATWRYETALLGLYAGDEVHLLTKALTWWSDVSGFSFGYAGDGNTGDIHVTTDDLGGNGNVILARAYNPNTIANYGTPDGAQGGDIIFTTNSQVDWYDNPEDTSGDGMYDFFTDALHETGHALGLDHPIENGSLPTYQSILAADSEAAANNFSTGVDSSIMQTYSSRGGAMNALSKYDIYLIQSLYGPGSFTPYDQLDDEYQYTGNNVIPEPQTLLLLSVGLLCLSGLSRKKLFQK